MSYVITKPHNNGLSDKLKEILKNKLCTMCPSKSKKLIFISSILALIKSIKDPDDVLIAKLNEIFKIAEYPQACIIPMRIKNLIWNNIQNNSIKINGREFYITDLPNIKLTDEETIAVGSFFIDHTPNWLKYSTRNDMIQDIRILIKQLLPVLS